MNTTVSITGNRIAVEHLELADADLAQFVGEQPAEGQAGLVQRALRVGLLCLRDAGVTVNVDFVEKEFGRLVVQLEARNQEAGKALEAALREQFAEDGGRLPRTLERFLGDQGALRRLVNDLFDESRRDSAIGRLNALLGKYFEGDGSQLAQLLDPTRLGSPLYQFRTEIGKGFEDLAGRITGLEMAAQARASERARSAAKGTDFEDLLEAMLGEVAGGLGDAVERTGTLAGETLKAKKGDFVLTIDPTWTRGVDLRVVVESKDRALSTRAITEELGAARQNRSAQAAVIVFTPEHAPANAAPLHVMGRDVWCVLDPAAPDRLPLECAVRLARIFAFESLRDAPASIDTDAVGRSLDAIRAQLSAVQGMKAGLTSIGTATKKVYADLDGLKVAILRGVGEIEAELRGASAGERMRATA
jgi:hypothetical protein